MTSDDPRRLILFAIWMSALTAILLWVVYLVRGVVLLVYVSVLFAVGLAPLVRLLERQRLLPIGTRRVPRWLAILVLYVAILGVVSAIAIVVLPPLVRQALDLWTRLPGIVSDTQEWLIRRGVLTHTISWSEAVEKAPGEPTDAAALVFEAAYRIIGGVAGLVTIIVLTFYLLIDGAGVMAAFIRLLPRDQRPRIAQAAREIGDRVSAWLSGQAILAGSIGSSAAIALFLLHVPYFYVLALIAAIGEVIPLVGPLLAAIPAIIVAFTVSPKLALLVAIFYLVQQQVENHVLVPKIMERQVGVNAITVIIALLVGASLLGIPGALLAVPTAAVVQVIVQEVLEMVDSGRTRSDPRDELPSKS